MSTPMQRLIGEVQSINDKGVKLDGEWHNFSKFSKPEAFASAQAGQWVELAIDTSGFVRSLQVAERAGTPPPIEPPAEYVEDEPASTCGRPGKDVLIVRQSMLKAAVDFAATRPELKSAEVLKLAEAFEKWVWRQI